MKCSLVLLFFIVYLGVNGQKDFKLYGAKFKASEILGGGEFGPVEQDHVGPFLSNNKIIGDVYDILGQYYTTESYIPTSMFLNKYSSVKQPILDSINFRFYLENGFEVLQIKKDIILNNNAYLIFDSTFKAKYKAGKFDELRDYVYDNKNREFRIALEKTRYKISQDKTFTLSTSQNNKLALGLGAEIKAIISKTINITGTLKAKLDDSIKTNLEIKDARYVEVSFNTDYVTIAGLILKKYEKNYQQLAEQPDVFSNDLLKFLQSGSSAVVTGAAILGIAVDYQKFQQAIREIGIVVSAEGKLEESKIASLKAELEALYKSKVTRDFGITTGVTYYVLKYGYSNILEIGKIDEYNKRSKMPKGIGYP